MSFRNFFLNFTICLFFVLYVLKQSLASGLMHDELNIILFFLGSISIIFNLYLYGFISSSIRVRKETILIYFTILIMFFLFQDASDAIKLLFKLVYISHLVCIFIKYKNSKIFILIADVILVSVLFTIILSKLGIFESNIVSYPNWTKSFGGFNNPNTGPYFLFSALTTYFIFERFNRFYLTLAVTLILFLFFDIFSRTFFYGSILLLIIHLIIFNYFFVKLSKYILLLFSIFGTCLLLLVIFNYDFFTDFFIFLAHSDLNLTFSNRLNTIRSWSHQVVTNTLSSIKFVPLDNIYYELLFVYGPFVLFKYIYNFLKTYRYVRLNPKEHTFLFRLCAVAILMSFLGLLEGTFTKISSLTILLFIFVFIGNYSFKDLDFRIKRELV